MCWEADCWAKTCACGARHTSELVAWAAVMKKDGAHSPTKEALQTTSPSEGSPKKVTMPVSGGEHAHPTLVFVKVGKKRFEVPPGYSGSLKAD